LSQPAEGSAENLLNGDSRRRAALRLFPLDFSGDQRVNGTNGKRHPPVHLHPARPLPGFGWWERQTARMRRRIGMPETVANPTLEQKTGGRHPSSTSDNKFDHDLQALGGLTTAQLRDEWRRLYRNPAPRLSRDLLLRGVVHRMQESAFGGMSKATRRKLAAFARELEANGR